MGKELITVINKYPRLSGLLLGVIFHPLLSMFLLR